MKRTLPVRYLDLKKNVDLANKLQHDLTKLAGRELSLGGSQAKGYALYVVRSHDRLVLGTVAYGNYNEVKNAIDVFCRTVQIL